MDKLLNLPLKKDSIAKVESFISVATSFEEITNASFFLCQIYCKLEMYDEAVSKLLELINDEVKRKLFNIYQDSLDMMIDIYKDTLNYDDAIKYIYKKRDSLAVFDIYKANIKLMDIFLLQGKKDEAASLCESILKQDIPNEEKYRLFKIIISFYLEEKNYDFSLKYIRYMKEQTYEIDDHNYYFALYFEAYATYMIKEYKTSYKMVLECIDNRMFFDNDLLIRLYVLDIKLLVALKEYKKAVVNEAEYENEILQAPFDVQNDFFDACIELYTSVENKLSLDMYLKRKKDLVEPKKSKKTIVVKKKIKEVEKKEEKTYKEDNKGIYYVVENMIKLEEIVLKQKIVPKFRDILLPLLIETNKIVPFDEMIIYNVDNREDSFYFKKERLYEKQFLDIRNTVIYEVLNTGKEALYGNKEDLRGLKDLITNQVYEYTDIKCLMALPIIDKEVKYVCLFYAFSEVLVTGFNYELLRFAVDLLADRIINHKAIKDLNIENNLFFNAFNYIELPIKYMIDKTVYLNEKARVFCKLPKKCELSEYMLHVKAEYYQLYREFLKSEEKEIKYAFNDLVILEKARKIFKDENIVISILEDVSLEKEKEEKENEIIYVDYLTKLYNLHAYHRDIMDLIREEKFSMILLNINKFSRINECYGLEYGNSVIRNTAYYVKEFFQTDKIYHFNADEFLIIVEGNNDARSINRRSLELLEYLRLHVNKKSTRLEATFRIGALRYKVQTIEKNPGKLLEYASFALQLAKQENDHFAYFDIEKYRENFHITSTVAHINEAIDLSRIGVKYHQIVDVEKSMISFYEIKPYVIDLDVSYQEIMRIVNLRGLTVKLERFMIKKTIKEILYVFEKKKKYVRISLSVNYETVLSSDFTTFMKKIIESYKLPSGLIIFDLYGKKKNISNEVNELAKLGILISTSKIEDALEYHVDYFKVDYLLPHIKSEKGIKTTKALVSMCNELNTKLIITNIEPKDIYILKENKVAYAHYGKEIVIEDIIKKME